MVAEIYNVDKRLLLVVSVDANRPAASIDPLMAQNSKNQMTEKWPANRYLELALLFLLALLWGSSYLFIKVGLETIPPFTLIAIRVTIAATLLTCVVVVQGLRFPVEPRQWLSLLVQSFLNSIGAWIVLAWGQQFVDSALAGILNSTSPIFVVFITVAWTRHEYLNWGKVLGALLGFGGVVMIIGANTLESLGEDITAQLAVLSGAALYGLAAINGKRFVAMPPSVTAASTMIWAAIVLVPASLIIDRPWTLAPSWISFGATAALAVFSTASALLIYFRLIRTIGSMGVASQAYLRIAVSVLLGVLFLGEGVSWTMGFGLAAVLVGVALINGHFRFR